MRRDPVRAVRCVDVRRGYAPDAELGLGPTKGRVELKEGVENMEEGRRVDGW